MILTRTPFRVTLGGGGTDLPSYYGQHGGFIFAMGLDKYMYIAVNRPMVGNKIRLHYSQAETVNHVGELEHELAREALRLHGIEDTFEIASIADLPSGSGLGSSSCYLVGLLNAIHHQKRDYVSLYRLAEEACHIELDILQEGIGKQDQYMAAFGGLTVLEIDRQGGVQVRQLSLSSGEVAELVAHTHLYYTGTERAAKEVLRDQDTAMKSSAEPTHERVADSLHRIKELGHRILEAVESGNFDWWGRLLHKHWELKKQLSEKISLSRVDEIYEAVRERFGVLGGKIVGAGGGGFLMLYSDSKHRDLESFMLSCGMPRMHYTIEPEGTKVMAQIGQGLRSRVDSPPPIVRAE